MLLFQISVSFSSNNSSVRFWALEAAAILATLEDSLVDDVLSKAENALVDHNEEAKVRNAVLRVFTPDLTILIVITLVVCY